MTGLASYVFASGTKAGRNMAVVPWTARVRWCFREQIHSNSATGLAHSETLRTLGSLP